MRCPIDVRNAKTDGMNRLILLIPQKKKVRNAQVEDIDPESRVNVVNLNTYGKYTVSTGA
jgi:hypothetical protein